MRSRLLISAAACCLTTLAFGCGGGGRSTLLLGATTSVQDAGLLDEIVTAFEAESGYDVTPVVGGSGQILEMARNGEFDVIITHSPEDERAFIDDGEGVGDQPFMENYFLVAGPHDDPAGAANVTTHAEVFQAIARTGQTFISRGDNSGTHKRELSIWKEAGVDPTGESWYQESAAGQGQSLLIASEKGAYTLVDSSTFITFAERVDLAAYGIDRAEPNVYSVIRVSPEKHPGVSTEAALAFASFLTSIEGRCLIANFGVAEYGEALFFTACPRSNTGG